MIWVGFGVLEKSEYNAIKIYKHSSLVSIFKAVEYEEETNTQ